MTFEPSKLTGRPDEWFKSGEGRTILANVVGRQNADGGWYKHYDIESATIVMLLVSLGHPSPRGARFYDIETSKPFFVSRDGIERETVDHVTRERRIGYAWYSIRPQKAIDLYNKKWKPANP